MLLVSGKGGLGDERTNHSPPCVLFVSSPLLFVSSPLHRIFLLFHFLRRDPFLLPLPHRHVFFFRGNRLMGQSLLVFFYSFYQNGGGKEDRNNASVKEWVNRRKRCSISERQKTHKTSPLLATYLVLALSFNPEYSFLLFFAVLSELLLTRQPHLSGELI